MMRPASIWLVAVLAVATGCARQPSITQASAPAPAGAPPVATGDTVGRPTAGGTAPRTTVMKPSRRPTTRDAGGARPHPVEYVDTPELQDIHFEFDRYALRDGDRLILERHAAWLREHTSTLLLIEGHCDARGTAEYNVGLGERRAKVTANYLASRGVASDRITIVSYGEERPVCREERDACRARNRRAHFRVKDQ